MALRCLALVILLKHLTSIRVKQKKIQKMFPSLITFKPGVRLLNEIYRGSIEQSLRHCAKLLGVWNMLRLVAAFKTGHVIG